MLSLALQITDRGLIFFSVNKHLSNNERTGNVLREKKNILCLFLFVFAVSSENCLDLETCVGRPEYESWRFLFVVGVGFAYWKQSALAEKRHTGDVEKRQVSGHFSTEDLGGDGVYLERLASLRNRCQYVVFPVDACSFSLCSPAFLPSSFYDVRITFLFRWCLDLIQCYHCMFFSLLGTVLGERFWGKKSIYAR